MTRDRPKVLILYNKLFHYRIPIWNLLAEKCDLTVTYSLGKVEGFEECKFEILYLPAKIIANRFCIQKDNLRKIAKQYDVVIAYGDIAWLKFSTFPWFNKQKVIFWTLGVSASYDKGFDKQKKWDRIRTFFYNQADALVFYTDYPIKKYAAMGISEQKMFEAPNTVKVLKLNNEIKRDSLLFIGTLYKQKGIQILLDSYFKVCRRLVLPHLYIIGDGDDFEYIKKWIETHNLTNEITLCGAIYNIYSKSDYLSRALACISPNQAGLSVLECMGYGVPFITSKNAITGGEIFNIHNGIDGIVMENMAELDIAIEDIALNPNKYVEMGAKAKKYYEQYRTPENMVQGLWNAISYVLKE